MPEIDKNYDARAVEELWYRRWEERRAFHADPTRGGKPYTIVIPPPNVTGMLHMGHALNATIQDILIRWRRMQGYNTLWAPGTDHAGIATQNVVERALRKAPDARGLGPRKFVQRVWEWREQYGGAIIRQLKRLGASCDWERERFTMDAGLSAAVTEVFVRLYEKQLIYRGNYIINWCPRCRTALSDEESEHVDTEGKLYYLRYPRTVGGKKEALIVATTRPETMLGDVALAVNPRDVRYSKWVGRKCLLPILKRALPVIADDFVDPEFGTGVVKITPAHDPNDFEMGQRHGLEPINVMDDGGIMNAQAGPYAGLDRFECRKRLLADLTSAGLVEKTEPHTHAVGHCYRCQTVVEPVCQCNGLSVWRRWPAPPLPRLKMSVFSSFPSVGPRFIWIGWKTSAIGASHGKYGGDTAFLCSLVVPVSMFGLPRTNRRFARPARLLKLSRTPDVLDTWFSSWLWPFTILGWPQNAGTGFYYPTNSLATAPEIIFFWVARMIVAGLEFMGDIPFKQVYIHGTVRDDSGRKMSKSLGNSIDPLTVIDEFSADALRFSMMMTAAVGQDVYLSNDKFVVGRNFLTKIWNAARFLQMNTEGQAKVADLPTVLALPLAPDDKHILVRLNDTITACTESLERFRFNDAAKELYEFVWRQYCDWYIEYAKGVLANGDAEARQRVVTVMHCIFAHFLRLLHPMAPFITEELWHGLGYGGEDDLIMLAPWPKPVETEEIAGWSDFQRMAAYVEDKHDLIRIGRTLRTDYGIPPAMQIAFVIRPESEEIAHLLAADENAIALLLRAKSLRVEPDYRPARAMPNAISRLGTVFMPVEGVIDIPAERRRLAEQSEKAAADLTSVNRKLDNYDFVRKAPPAIVEQQRVRKQELLEKIEKLKRMLAVLADAG